MPAKDVYHETVKNALIKDGWKITDDPLHLQWGSRDLYIDLGAEKLIAAEKDNQKIAVEIKSFLSPSPVRDLENAIGQFILYHDILEELQPKRVLYLAINEEVFIEIFSEPIGKILLDKKRLKLLIFDVNNQEIVRWSN